MSKRRVACLVLLLPALLLCWLVMGFSINLWPQNPIQQLESAQKLWRQQGIDDYRMTVAFSAMSNIGRYNFIVQDGAPMSIAVWSSLELQPTPEALQNIEGIEFQYYGTAFPKKLTDYTIDRLFDFAARKLADQPPPSLVTWCGMSHMGSSYAEVTFNAQLGYIDSLKYDDCSHGNFGGGLLCPAIGDCFAGIRILDFEPLQ